MIAEINWTTVLVAACAAIATGIPATIIALKTGKAVDGRMTELLEITRRNAGAEATLAEKGAEQHRQSTTTKQRRAEDVQPQPSGAKP